MKLTVTIIFALAMTLFTAGFWAGQRADRFEEGRNAAIREIAGCTLEAARRDECWIPCATDTDCLQKNGQADH